MFRTVRSLPLMICLLVLGFGAVQAQAAVVDLGPSGGVVEAPHLVVDANGQGYTSWVSQDTSATLNYCRLTVPTAACANRQTFSYAPGPGLDTDSGNSPVLLESGQVALLDARCCQDSSQKFLYVSPDGGQTFAAPVPLTVDHATGMPGRLIDVPSGALAPGSPEQLVTSDDGAVTYGGSIQATGLAPAAADPGWFAPLNDGGTLSESVARQGSTLVVVYTQATRPDYRVSWAANTGGDPNAAASWSAPQDISPGPSIDSGAQLADGPSGIFMIRSIAVGATGEQLGVQRFTGTGWTAPVTVSTAPAGMRFAITETPGGTVYVIYKDQPTGKLQYRIASDPMATRFDAPITLATGSNTVDFPAIAVDAAGAGWVTWTDDASTAHAVPITPIPRTTNLALSDGSTVSLGSPRGCVAPGAKFTVTLGFQHSKRKGAVYVKVTRTDFSLAGSPLKTVSHAPFRATFTLRATARRGAVVRVRARATIKVHHGKPPKKSIYAKVMVCS